MALFRCGSGSGDIDADMFMDDVDVKFTTHNAGVTQQVSTSSKVKYVKMQMYLASGSTNLLTNINPTTKEVGTDVWQNAGSGWSKNASRTWVITNNSCGLNGAWSGTNSSQCTWILVYE